MGGERFVLRWIHGFLDDAMLPLLKVMAPGYRDRLGPFRACDECAVDRLGSTPAPSEVALTQRPDWRRWTVTDFQFDNPVDCCPWDDQRVSGRLLISDPAAPWVLIVPGYSTGALPPYDYSFFQTTQARAVLQRRLNAALIDLPFHLLRRRSRRLSGEGFFSPDLVQTQTAILQGLADSISTIRWLSGWCDQPVGIWGTSLGGCIAGLTATQVPELAAVVLMEPLDNPGDPLAVLPGSQEIRDVLAAHGIEPEEIPRLLRSVAPSSYRPAVPLDRILMLTPEWDRVVPPRFQEQLWEQWGRPPRVRFETGHIGLATDRKATAAAADFFSQRLIGTVH